MGKILDKLIFAMVVLCSNSGSYSDAAVLSPGGEENCESRQRHDYATTIITSDNPPPLVAPVPRKKKKLFSGKDSDSLNNLAGYSCGTPCFSFDLGSEVYLKAAQGSSFDKVLTANELIFRKGACVLASYSDDVFLRVFDEAGDGLSLIVKLGGPSLLMAARSDNRDDFQLTNVWGEAAIVYVYEGQSFQSLVVNPGEEIRVAGKDVDDSEWLPSDSIKRNPIVAPVQIPGAKLAKYQINRADFYIRHSLFRCRNYPDTMPKAIFELARRSLKEECGRRDDKAALNSTYTACGCLRW